MNNTIVYLGFGGNKGKVLPRLKRALHFLSLQEGINDLRFSHFYQTAPLNVESREWFVNSVCSFETPLTLQELFKVTQQIEIRFGKVKKPKHASRAIDIDILFYGNQICHDEELVIPHPLWQDRLFVLIPLSDLTNEIFLSTQASHEHHVLNHLIQSLSAQSSQTVSLLEKNPYI